MKILIRGDIHLGLVSDGLSRLEEQERILDHTIEVLRDVDPDVFVDLGDLFDGPRPTPDVYAAALLYSREVGNWAWGGPGKVRAFVLAGNHDKPTRGEVHALTPLARLGQFVERFIQVVEKPTRMSRPGRDWKVNDDLADEWGGVHLIFLPYVTDWEARQEGKESAQELLDDFVTSVLESEFERTVVFTHLEVPGARYADDDRTQRDVGTRVPDALFEDERVVRIYAGHVHKYQELEKVTVVGSALHVDFGEAADPKGMILAEV